ncbi:MAG: ATP-dependent DNA helicase RecG [Alphaproteobacteria bacterium]|nr:ATP-dependent DNA helicase RecG [Alphaproteobacteria bacterium]
MNKTSEFLSTPIARLATRGLVSSVAKIERACGGKTLRELILHLPRDVADRTYAPALAAAEAGRIATVRGHVIALDNSNFRRTRKIVIAEDSGGECELVFFKPAPWVFEKFRAGDEVAASGKLEISNGRLQIVHPDYIEAASEFERIAIVESIYPLTYALSNKTMRKFIGLAFAKLPRELGEASTFFADLQALHTNPLLEAARGRLALTELVQRMVAMKQDRINNAGVVGSAIAENARELESRARRVFGFELTSGQESALSDIIEDMKSDKRMMRLVQGDVGSGKTAVAILAALFASESGKQTAIMAPTEILASQHLATLTKLFARAEIEVGVEILTARDKGRARTEKLQRIAAGEVSIVVGTHSMLQDDVAFAELGLIIIDEQHKFGVAQRAALGLKSQAPANLLLLSATPIPRTLEMALYGNMDVSSIKTLPIGRKPIKTQIFSKSKREEIARGMLEKMQADPNLKAYWVCPLVVESEKTYLEAVKKRGEELREIFGPALGITHGKIKADEKARVISEFANPAGGVRLLLATTVIEVGVNVPEASVMVIENAERFGLATLHQLRGRVGRGAIESTCILIYDKLSETAKLRLETMRSTTDGFVIAERDLQIRGAGDVAGVQQSGALEFIFARMPDDAALLAEAEREAEKYMKNEKWSDIMSEIFERKKIGE